MKQKKKILLVTRNFPPVIGGMERLLHHCYDELSSNYRLALVGPEGCEAHVSSDVPVKSCPLAPVSRFFLSIQSNSYRLAGTFEPDIIMAGSGVAAPAAVVAARRIGVPVICYLHGLDLTAKSLIYQAVFVRAIRACDVLVVNSHSTARLAQEKGVEGGKIRVLFPGISMPCGDANRRVGDFRRAAGLDANTKILLSVGRLTGRKGLPEFVDKVLWRVVARDPDVHMVIIGDEPRYSLKRSGDVKQRLLEAIAARSLEKNVTLLGNVDDSMLSSAYAASSILVFPVIDLPGDVEGFGMVALEAAAHGLPTVAFAAGGVPDAVKDGVSGWLVEPDDYDRFFDAIMRHLDEPGDSRLRSSCRDFAGDYTWSKFGDRLRAIVAETLGLA